jgi:trehalose 6-phosphate synthase/phosphatase
MSRLLIVSNRLPVTVKNDGGKISITRSSGGLATGLKGPHERSDSLWLGWPGDVSRMEAKRRAELTQTLLEIRTAPVYLSSTEIKRFYEGFSNGVLWPLYHYLIEKMQSNVWKDWQTYAEVNQRFADAVVERYQPGDLIWVHDYQLSLVPGMIRKQIADARIGFFLHIPFPSSDVFRILPWRSEILEGMLGSDLLGFHTYSYVRHFVRSLNLVLGVDTEGEVLQYGSRDIRLGVFPMGIDAHGFEGLAQDPEVLKEVASIRKDLGGRKLLLGVDRLDYTKGLTMRMSAVERLLEREPSLRGKIRVVQVVVPSRTKVESYAVLRRHLDEMVGRINGEYGTIGSVPVHYLYRSISEKQLVALYRSADVMLVTPLRDGMNLVAKEFVASRPDEDGVLVLSEFAGASTELVESISVNPYDSDRVASAMQRALTMPEEQRRTRMRALRRRVKAFDSFHWAEAFMEALQSSGTDPSVFHAPMSSDEEVNELVSRMRAAKQRLLLLDYDGTLVPFASAPLLAAPDEELKRLLSALSAQPGTRVHVVSGRGTETMEKWFKGIPIGLHSEHGLWSRMSAGDNWVSQRGGPAEWKKQVLPILERFAASTPGSMIEEKTAALAWHYRMADPELGALHSKELGERLAKELGDLPVEVLLGARVVEVRARGIHKGLIAARLVGKGSADREVLAMGDDHTDEDLFAALPKNACSVHIGRGPSRAHFRLPDPAAARALLERLVD